MKLIVCKECGDIFVLLDQVRGCTCGKSIGRYMSAERQPPGVAKVEVKGPCAVIGFSNSSFVSALRGRTENFEAFVIPDTSEAIVRENKLSLSPRKTK